MSRISLWAALLVPFLLVVLGCSGFTPKDYGTELGHTPIRNGKPFVLTVEGTGQPLHVWAKSNVGTRENRYWLEGNLVTRIEGRPPTHEDLVLDERGVHTGPYTHPKGKPRASARTTGFSVSTKRLASLPAVPVGETVTIRGVLSAGGGTQIRSASLVITE